MLISFASGGFSPRSVAGFPGTRRILTDQESDSESGKRHRSEGEGEGREVTKVKRIREK